MKVGNVYQVEYRKVFGAPTTHLDIKVAALNVSEAIEGALKINSSEIVSVRLVLESVFF